MFSSYIRLLSTQQSRQFTRPFFSKKPEPANQPQPNTVKPRRNILPIMTYDGQGPTNGYFISLMNASEKRAALAQLEDCDYTITHEFPEKYACFSGLVATIFRLCMCSSLWFPRKIRCKSIAHSSNKSICQRHRWALSHSRSLARRRVSSNFCLQCNCSKLKDYFSRELV